MDLTYTDSKVVQFLVDHDIPYIDTSSGLRISCFNKSDHKRGDLNPSLSIHPVDGYFHCWGCHVSGSFPQLIAALGYRSEIKKYTGLSLRNINIDISHLKKESNRLSIPGLGVFIQNNREDMVFYEKYVKSKKFTKLLPNRYDIYENDSFEKRLELINRISDNSSEYVPPSDFYRVEILDYLSERGIPVAFQRTLELYLHRNNQKYFYMPIYNVFRKRRSLLAISFNRETDPRMYFVNKISSPILGLETLNREKDVYVVEGWLDFLKMKCMGYNSIALLGNSFTAVHYSVLSSVSGKKYFVFDQDVGGVQNLKRLLKFVSITDSDWIGVFIDYKRYKDIGDIEVLDIPKELLRSNFIGVSLLKNYIVILGGTLYGYRKEEFDFDRCTFRGDTFFAEFPKKFCGT